MDINTLDIAGLTTLRAKTHADLKTLLALDAPTTAQVAEANGFAKTIRDIDARKASLAADAKAFADLKDTDFSEKDEDAEAKAKEEADAKAKEAEDAKAAEAAAAAPAEPVAVVEPAPAAAPAPVAPVAEPAGVAAIAAQVNRPTVPGADTRSTAKIISKGEGTGFALGSNMENLEQVAQAAINKMRGFPTPNGNGEGEDLKMHPVASFATDFPTDLQINRNTDDMEVLYHAADESRLDGNSLTAAGGWCAPSETMYDLKSDESLEGILSIPEVQVNRGGIRYTVGPQFADFYTNAGFIQTETQAIAGTTKPCYEVSCPAFTDVRLDAVGLCIKVPFLTNAAYPELTARFTSGTLIAHEHMVNANVIGRMVTLSGAARVFTGLGSTVSDSMEALELVADQRRQTYRLPLQRSLEVVVPFWIKAVFRNDLARRQGVAAEAISDAQIAAHFAARNLAVQYVYDWQNLDLTAEVYPDTFQAMIYPAGTFVKGVSDVVNLSAVYDAASLQTNVYTGLFVEKGLLVAKMQYASDLVTLPICSAGRVGAADLTCAP